MSKYNSNLTGKGTPFFKNKKEFGYSPLKSKGSVSKVEQIFSHTAKTVAEIEKIQYSQF